ncbi:MAG TPA: S-adenosylmethionine:tRNA ribosyltransferase-isomerase [bacterium]|nr:S-adenosylmethionine:tRNA ribosyltransferase-isomerase [bacterium]
MDVSLFDFQFPKELVAQHPLPRREDSRMMVLDRTERRWEHRTFSDLPSFLRAGDVLVMNNALADLVELDGRRVPALPPYIKRKKAEDFTEVDFQRYRTVYGAVPGSKAAPTAGFHFSEEMLEKIRALGVETRFVTLQVGFDTYKPIRSENVLGHPMHGEAFDIPPETAEAVARAKQEGRRVIAVGTTAVRALESWAAVGANLVFAPKHGITHLFITPGYDFRIVDALLTNFHRPRSTVLVMVATFAGREFILSAYEEAIRERYRLFSYGDCMLIV